MLKDTLSNGQTGTLSDDDAKSLYQHAEDALKTAEAKVPKPKH